MPLMSPLRTVLLVLSGLLMVWCWGVEATHHRRHHHPSQQQHLEEPPVPVRHKFPYLDRLLHRYDEGKMGHHHDVVRRPAPTPATTTTTTTRPFQPQDVWKTKQGLTFAADYEDELDSDSDDYYNMEMDQRDQAPQRRNITSEKWRTLGTRQGVEKAMEQQSIANFHAQELSRKMMGTTTCKVPQPRFLKVKDLEQSPSRSYAPSCVVLHRCAEDTGCCDRNFVCSPKTTHMATLYLYVSEVGKGAEAKAVHLLNHTECHCAPQGLNRGLPPIRRSASAPRTSNFGEHPSVLHRPMPAPASFTMKNDKESCICPRKFTVRTLTNGSCSCDCFDKERECLRFKKGKDSFSRDDSDCILEGRCRRPVCEFGSYRDDEGRGRCPMKSEQYLPLQEGIEMMPRHVPPLPQAPQPAPRHVQAPANPPIPDSSWQRLAPSRPNGVPRVLVPEVLVPLWASTDDNFRKESAWKPQGLFNIPTPSALSSRPSIRSAPSTTTSTTTTTTSTTAAPAAAPLGPRWDPQPITAAPAAYSWQTPQTHLHQKTHEPAPKHHWATMPKWSFTSSDHNSGFPWNPEETMRFKHNRKTRGV